MSVYTWENYRYLGTMSRNISLWKRKSKDLMFVRPNEFFLTFRQNSLRVIWEIDLSIYSNKGYTTKFQN